MTTFVICGTCHQRCEDDVCPHCGSDPAAGPTDEVVPVVEVAEELGEHRFSLDPRDLPLCLDCGVSLDEAMSRRCGPS